MGLLKDSSLSLDNLIVYSKLQDLLSALIVQVDQHHESIAQLRVDADEAAERLDSQESGLELLRQDMDKTKREMDASVAEMKNSIKEQNREIQTLRNDVDKKIEDMSTKMNNFMEESTNTLNEVKAEIVVIHSNIQGLGLQQAALEKAQTKMKDEINTTLEDKQQQIDAIIKTQEKAAEKVDGLAQHLDDTAKKLGNVQETVDLHEKKLTGEVQPKLRKLSDGLDGVRGNFEDEKTKSQQRLNKVEADMTKRLEELRGTVAKMPDPADFAALRQAVDRVEDAVKNAKPGTPKDIDAVLDVIKQKQGEQQQKLTNEVKTLKAQMESFLDTGASGTARCLSCFSRRAQKLPNIVVGTDGKTYIKGNQGENLGRLNIPEMRGRMSPNSLARGRPPGGLSASTGSI